MAKKLLAVVIPIAPSFIRVGENYISIHEFTDKELRAIGKEWTEKLIMKAHKIAQLK